VKQVIRYLLAAALLGVGLFSAAIRGGLRGPAAEEDGVRGAIDSLNSRAFDMRYKDIPRSKELAAGALRLIAREAPGYLQGRAEALNQLAYANYLTSRFDSTRFYLDLVREIEDDYPGRQIEEAITLITEARLCLRECRYAEAFTIYDSTITIFKNPLRGLRYGGSRRYDWARSDYLIGNAVLDYYYRETKLDRILPSLDEVARRPRLHIDTTQLGILHYTYAGAYEQAIGDSPDNLLLALDNVEAGLGLMAPPASRNDHGLANLYQITANILLNPATARWLAEDTTGRLYERLNDFRERWLVGEFGWSRAETASPDLGVKLLEVADSLFVPIDDPYQNLASTLYIADVYLARGDTVRAAEHFRQGVAADSTMTSRGGSAPIWTARLYNTLIENAPADTPAGTLKRWYGIYSREKAIIDVNERRDYNTQRERDAAKTFARRTLTFAGLILAVCAVVSLLSYFLWKRNRQLRFMQAKLIEQKRMELLTHVVRGISHELSQPLGSITQTLYDTRRDVATLQKGRAHLSDERYDELVAGVAADLGVIARGKESISDLVTSFRNTIRENVIDPEAEFNLLNKLEDIVKVLRPGIKPNIGIETDCPPGLTVRTFPLLFSQVVTNLISNAGQHAFPDSDSPDDRIRLECRASGRDLVVRCVDNGIGIPEGELERLCQPFVSKRRSNLGLGLSLVKNIVEQYMNGTIAFASDGGLAVTVTIPSSIVKK
jgi:signal transduction histidine kinase